VGVVLQEGNVHAESFLDGVNLHICVCVCVCACVFVSTMIVIVVLIATFHV
jgi:hypothetical protein